MWDRYSAKWMCVRKRAFVLIPLENCEDAKINSCLVKKKKKHNINDDSTLRQQKDTSSF